MQIEEVLKQAGVDFRPHGQHHHTRVGWLQVDCPRCSPKSQKWRLGYNLTSGLWACWYCGPMPRIATLAAVLGTTTADAKSTALLLPRRMGPIERTQGKFKWPLNMTDTPTQAHKKYLGSRGCSQETIDQYGLRFTGWDGDPSWRIVIPVRFDRVPVSWTARAIGNAPLRYISADAEDEDRPIKSCLFGAEFAVSAVTIHEGPFDAIAVGPGAVSLCGTGYTKTQVRLLSRYPVRTIVFDSERLAQERAAQLASALSVFPGITQRITLDAKDAGAATREEIRELRRVAMLDGA